MRLLWHFGADFPTLRMAAVLVSRVKCDLMVPLEAPADFKNSKDTIYGVKSKIGSKIYQRLWNCKFTKDEIFKIIDRILNSFQEVT